MRGDIITDLGTHLAGVLPPRHSHPTQHRLARQPRVQWLRHHQARGGRREGGGGLGSTVSSCTEVLHGVYLHLGVYVPGVGGVPVLGEPLVGLVSKERVLGCHRPHTSTSSPSLVRPEDARLLQEIPIKTDPVSVPTLED